MCTHKEKRGAKNFITITKRQLPARKISNEIISWKTNADCVFLNNLLHVTRGNKKTLPFSLERLIDRTCLFGLILLIANEKGGFFFSFSELKKNKNEIQQKKEQQGEFFSNRLPYSVEYRRTNVAIGRASETTLEVIKYHRKSVGRFFFRHCCKIWKPKLCGVN